MGLAELSSALGASSASTELSNLFGELDSDSNGSISKDELGSLLDSLTNSGKSSTVANSGYADLVASLLKQYSENVSYSSTLGSQISLSA